MILDGENRDLEAEKIPVMAFRPSHEAKLRELLHKICLHEIKLCSDAAKEFVKLLKGETGGDLLRLYFQNSPEFGELLEAWRLRQGKQGFSYIFKLIQTVMSHPEGKGRETDIGRAIDRFGMLLVKEYMDDIYKELNSKVGKQQNAALSLLASIVRRGQSIASEVAKVFDFKGFAKLGEYKTRGAGKVGKHSTRRAFVVFAIAFLEVGKPGLLRSVLQQKEMYSKVLGGLGIDDEETLAYVFSSLKEKILVEESLIPPGLRSVLFGSATLQQLINISAREDSEIASELAHDVLVKVCTDPSNGLMPDAKRNLRGNSNRLLMLMKKLRATEIGYHRDLLLAIVRGRPSLASAFLEEFPYNVENLASPSWFSSTSLAANLVASVRSSCSFDFLNPDIRAALSSCGPEVQTIMKCICPRPFSQALINKGMQHSDHLVKHVTVRFLLETLGLWDSFITSWNHSSSRSGCEQIQASLERDVMCEVRSFFPDAQVLLTLLQSVFGSKRKAGHDIGSVGRIKRFKKCDNNVLDEDVGDIVIGGVVSSGKDIYLVEDPVDTQMEDQADEKEYLGTVSEIWASELGSKPIESVEEADILLHKKLLEALSIYARSVPNVHEGSFDVLMKYLSSSSSLPAELQRALLSLLNEYISWTPNSQSGRVPTRIPPLMYKQLDVLVNFSLFSPHSEVKDLARSLAMVAMGSTGAFENNSSEVAAWFLFLPCSEEIKQPLKVQEAVQSMSSVVISFLCDAVSTVGNNLFKHWEIIRSSLSHLKGKCVSIGFSPLIVCILQKSVRLLNSESKRYSLPEKSAISLYVCSTLKYLLQTQVDSRLLACLVQSVLSEVIDGSKDFLCEWWPLRMLLGFSQSLSEKNPFILHSKETNGVLDHCSFADSLDEIKGLLRSISPDEIPGTVKAFSSALVCATPESIMKSFGPVMAVSWDLYGTSFSFLQSIIYLEENFLGNLSKLSPDLFARGSKLIGSGNVREGTVDMEFSAFSMFLEQAPFPVLFSAVMSMDISCIPEFPRISELLLLKVSQRKGDSIESDIKLILFWLSQIRSSYQVQLAQGLYQLSEICLRLMKHLFSQLSERELLSGPSSGTHQVTQTVLCHPVVMALLESPMDCSTLSRMQSVEKSSEPLLTTSRLVISDRDQHILDLLASTCEHFLFDEKLIVQKGDLWENKSITAFKALVEMLLLKWRVKFELCVSSQRYAPLLQPTQMIYALLRFISPFRLLYLARSMLIDVEDLESPDLSMIRSLGLDIAGGAFEMLILYSQQTHSKRKVYDLLWELEENNYDSNLIGEVYEMACKFSTSFSLESANLCLLKVCGGIFRSKQNQNCSVHPLTVIITKIVGTTPEDLIVHFINKTSMTRAKVLFYFVECSPLHLSVFGHVFCSMVTEKPDDYALTADQFMMLLPAVLSYLRSFFAKLEKPSRMFLDITSVYSNILINGFAQWPGFLSGCIFEEKYEELLLTATEDIDIMFNASLLGKAICMLQYHFALSECTTTKDDLQKVLESMFPQTSAGKEMLDYEIKEVDVQSIDQMLNVAIRVVAKVSLSTISLFPEDSSICHLKREADSCVEGSSLKPGSDREKLLKQLLNALVNSWLCVVKKSDGSLKGNSEGKQDKGWSLCKSLENFILRSILKSMENMCDELVILDSLPFLERLMKSVLQYRFEDSTTWKILREIVYLLPRGEYSYAPCIQLLISHSQFIPTISSLSALSMASSHTGELFRPVSSILRHLMISSSNSVDVGSCCSKSPEYSKQLEVVRILRLLLSGCGNDSEINLKELHFVLLCSYGATLSEIDVEIYKLMHDIEVIDPVLLLDVSETGHLWGKAALKTREGLSVSQDASDVGYLIHSLFKENLCVDPKVCALTVLNYPYQRTAEVSEKSYLNDDPISETCSPVIKDIEGYDPAFILRFSNHSLSMGYIEPVEFTSLGLLAVAFASMSSADLAMRKLAYETLDIFMAVLENCRKNKDATGLRLKHVKRLRLLLIYVKNAVEEPWQRIPTVSAVFAAEASLILLDVSHEHHVPINKLLNSSSTMKLRGVPLFDDFFQSIAVNFRSQRLWELRLVCAGLISDDDAHIYMRNSILETLMSFSSTPLADEESKRLIMQVVKRAVKFHKMARHLVEKCGLFSWCSAFISTFSTKLTKEDDLRLVVILEVITDILASRNVSEWLQRYALEGLMEISSRLYKLLGGGLVSIQENGTSVDLILQILFASLKLSQKRNIYQPHFTVTIEGLFQLFEVVASCDPPQVEVIAERVLDTILMSTPPVDIVYLGVDKLRRFLLWGTSTALKSDLKKGSKQRESYLDTKTLTEEPQEETMVEKFLRWLLASVILGKLYSKANDSDPTVLSKEKPETLLTLLEQFKGRNPEGIDAMSEHIIAEVIVHLQQLLCTNYRVLPSVVCALSLMLLHNGLEVAGSESSDDHKLIRSLCSRISSPPEATPAWRWSYYQAWKYLSPEPVTDLEKIDTIHACQHLLSIFSDKLGGEKPRESQQMLLHKSFDMSSVFEWERGLV
ncbi:unnamed protein product [Cochlearia groenlandica]